MKAARIDRFGGPDVLTIVERTLPEPGDHEALVRVAACGLNFSDLLQREGLYRGGPKPPFYPGVEAAGVIEGIGSQVSADLTGSRIACLTSGGAHAEYLLVDSRDCVPLPPSLSLPEGAALLIQYLTAYHALTTAAHAREGETVLIHAAAGGVGTAAVQIARLLGLRVVGTASTSEKCRRILDLGAERAALYEDFEGAVREVADGKGPQLILDTVGGEVFRRSLALLPPFGRLVIVGATSGDPQPIDPVKLVFGSQAVIGFHLNAVLANKALLRQSLARIMEWIARGRIRVQIGGIFPLTDIRRAHEFLGKRESYGKVVLAPHPGTDG